MSRLGEALTEAADPPIAAMVVFNANPAASNPNQVRVRRGLARDDLFTVVLEQRLTDTTRLRRRRPARHDAAGAPRLCTAPTATSTSSGTSRRSSLPARRRTNTDVFRAIAKSMGLEHPRLYDSDLELARAAARHRRWRARGVTLAALRERGWMRGAGFERGTAPFAEGGFPTASGKVELVSAALGREGQSTRSSASCPPTRCSTRSWRSATRSC